MVTYPLDATNTDMSRGRFANLIVFLIAAAAALAAEALFAGAVITHDNLTGCRKVLWAMLGAGILVEIVYEAVNAREPKGTPKNGTGFDVLPPKEKK